MLSKEPNFIFILPVCELKSTSIDSEGFKVFLVFTQLTQDNLNDLPMY